MNLLTLPGDGIGPEVTQQALRVADWLASHRGLALDVTSAEVGGISIDRHATPLTDAVYAQAEAADAILFGAVGGPAWEALPRSQRPEQGLLRLRRGLGLFANLRPAVIHRALDLSPLRPERLPPVVSLVIVRELTGGVYFGEPRGQSGVAPDRTAVDTQVYSEAEIARVAHVAFRLAAGRAGSLHLVDKANVMATGQLWRAVVADVAPQYPAVRLHHMFADNCATQLVLRPEQFDVILTDNLFGDLLSDLAAGLVGSLGLLPSASLGVGEPGRTPGLYEPIHGSAPDIAGQNKANPVATILSLALALRHSLARPELAAEIEAATAAALSAGARTPDLGGAHSTTAMTDAILAELTP